MVRKYKNIGELVAKLQCIFEVWFVLAWGIYFIGLTGNTVLVFKILLNNPSPGYNHKFWFYLAHLIYDISAFTVPYICSASMNYYHDMFHTALGEMQEKIFDECESLADCLLLNASAIPPKPHYHFIPALFCINIPLASAGFTLTIILAIFAFLMSFITAITRV